MTFIYDVLLNYTNNYYYDFYEWDKKDNIVNVKKIPLIRVNKNILCDFINYKIKVNKSFLHLLDNKSIYLKKDKDRYNYSVILSSGEKSIGIVFNDDGIIIYKSSMLLDEDEDACRLSLKQKEINIKYKKYDFNSNILLRCDINKKNNIIKELKRIIYNKEYDRLKYIYYEIFNKTSNDIDNMYNKLTNSIDNFIDKYDLLLIK